jgi:SAM-dependent methyltransferase
VPAWSPPLICPLDQTELTLGAGPPAYECRRCGQSFPLEQGVVRFLPGADAFYEGRYLNTIRFVPRSERAPWSWPLWLIASGYVWAVRRHVRAGSFVLELGSGSGIAYLSRRYRAVGVDLSLASLARVAPLYAACLQADVTRSIPLPDGSLDAAISSFVWEHLRPEDKPRVLAELRRVLRPDGRLVFLYDVENRHPLYRRMQRRDPARYREVLIDREGHLGWETQEENARRFEEAGFELVEHRGMEKLLIAPAMYDKVGEWPGGFGALARLGLWFRFGGRFQFYNALVRVLDESVGRLLPRGWARVMLTVCRRS